ncbi:MAG: hypothetical protein M3Y57_01940 [Acidobacteriota bacterium]|nr:hypothetical protein [Acidobacteriota bacterium]
MKKHILAAALLCGTSALYSQQIPEFNVAGRSVQMHAFASQGFGYFER